MGIGFRMSVLKNMVFIAHLHQSPSLTHTLDPPSLLQWDVKQFQHCNSCSALHAVRKKASVLFQNQTGRSLKVNAENYQSSFTPATLPFLVQKGEGLQSIKLQLLFQCKLIFSQQLRNKPSQKALSYTACSQS